jgi:hypothetical protein
LLYAASSAASVAIVEVVVIALFDACNQPVAAMRHTRISLGRIASSARKTALLHTGARAPVSLNVVAVIAILVLLCFKSCCDTISAYGIFACAGAAVFKGCTCLDFANPTQFHTAVVTASIVFIGVAIVAQF